eukprot:CAMPEP_0114266916 /NCGR_PEP_ID=MMETSP0058-20121206/24920_1 /TAXON_ID=36894 /ORGANISM="Pyramimonas parkeae, CCMP726" /LENGTH=144 /DNA_ID=CAMNT_0001384539 /DNA_START=1035 /DNA_END=1470 /DNA_ORIENTATION=-
MSLHSVVVTACAAVLLVLAAGGHVQAGAAGGRAKGPQATNQQDDSVSACMNFDLPDKNAPKPTTSRVRDAVVPCWVLDWREDDFEGRDKREKAIPKPKCTAEQRRDMMNKIKSMTNDVHKTRAERVALESKLMELKKAMVEAPP